MMSGKLDLEAGAVVADQPKSLERNVAFGPFQIDLRNACVRCGQEILPLTPKAFSVLLELVKAAGVLVSKEELFKAVWPNLIVTDAALTVCIREIRKALGDLSRKPRYIETVHKRGYRFIGAIDRFPEASSGSPGEPAKAPAGASLIGRKTALCRLREALERALRGERQIVLVTGEAGIGKTALIEAFAEEAGRANTVWVTTGQCIEQHGVGEAYLPVLDALGRLCRSQRDGRLIQLLAQYAPTWLAQMPSLVNPADGTRQHAAEAAPERMLREMAEALEAIACERPLLLCLEDLHWSDYATIDLLSFLARRRNPSRLLILGTYRPADAIVYGHPIKKLKQELLPRDLCSELPLELLTRQGVQAYLASRYPSSPFVPKLAQVVHRRTDGNPLFMINVLEYLQRQKLLVAERGQWVLRAELGQIAACMPDNLKAMIGEQIDQLTAEEQRLLEAASVASEAGAIDERFSSAEVAAVLDVDRAQAEAQYERLARHGHFLCAIDAEDAVGEAAATAHFQFTHALYQNVLYRRVPPAGRTLLHQRIGEWLEKTYGDRAGEIAVKLAVHFERGCDYRRAVDYLERAAQRAAARGANWEVTQCLEKALKLLQKLPDTPARGRQELALLELLGPALIALKGNAASPVEKVYLRAYRLCQQLGDCPQQFSTLFGLRSFYLISGRIEKAHALGEQLLRLAQDKAHPEWLLEAHAGLASTLFFLGQFSDCLSHAQNGIALYQSRCHPMHVSCYGLDPGIFCHARAGQALWMLGYPDRALQRVLEALSLARQVAHPYSLAFALHNVAWVHWCRREGEAAKRLLDESLALACEHGFAFLQMWGLIMEGCALALERRHEEALDRVRRGLAVPLTASSATHSYLLTLAAEACSLAGELRQGVEFLRQAIDLGKNNGEQFLQAERHRLQGALGLQAGCGGVPAAFAWPEPEVCYRQALAIARRQQARSFELRAALNLSRLFIEQNRQVEAEELLSGLYPWFKEGLDTFDLIDAASLLDSLQQGTGN